MKLFKLFEILRNYEQYELIIKKMATDHPEGVVYFSKEQQKLINDIVDAPIDFDSIEFKVKQEDWLVRNG